jgi:hypothetical protein
MNPGEDLFVGKIIVVLVVVPADEPHDRIWRVTFDKSFDLSHAQSPEKYASIKKFVHTSRSIRAERFVQGNGAYTGILRPVLCPPPLKV